MKVAIIGGKLQGTEAAYLASAAGFESVLIDNNLDAPASTLADRFICGNICARDPEIIKALKEADFVLPANENDAVLTAICEICEEEGLKLAFDMDAYRISQSKVKSDALMHENGVPAPLYYPEGKAPYIIKPSGESGSAGIQYAETEAEVERFLAGCPDPENWIIQEYLTGPSYSIEVIGKPGNYRTYTITQIHMDEVYDCCKVTAPCAISDAKKDEFAKIAVRLAELVNLHGIMDVEVIDDGEALKVLEIDARIPSQTPICILKSSGMNFVRELADITVNGKFEAPQVAEEKYSAYEHYKREHGAIIQEGEHMMSSARPLAKFEGFAGSQSAVTDYRKGTDDFRGIFINAADTFEELETIRMNLKENLKRLP